MDQEFERLNERIIGCTRCPRLVEFREHVPFRKAYAHEKGWRKPVPGFGDENAWLLIAGLAPSIEGGNRTGRIFTGDGSARFLIKVLYEAGLANQPTSLTRDDGLQLKGCYITATVKCVPPDHRPSRQECLNCFPYLENEFFLLKNLRAVLALGKFAFDSFQDFLITQGALQKRESFAHGKAVSCPGWPTLFATYHPSPQNTNTGLLTEEMFLSLLERLK